MVQAGTRPQQVELTERSKPNQDPPIQADTGCLKYVTSLWGKPCPTVKEFTQICCCCLKINCFMLFVQMYSLLKHEFEFHVSGD